jgi:hypothetical protein
LRAIRSTSSSSRTPYSQHKPSNRRHSKHHDDENLVPTQRCPRGHTRSGKPNIATLLLVPRLSRRRKSGRTALDSLGRRSCVQFAFLNQPPGNLFPLARLLALPLAAERIAMEVLKVRYDRKRQQRKQAGRRAALTINAAAGLPEERNREDKERRNSTGYSSPLGLSVQREEGNLR